MKRKLSSPLQILSPDQKEKFRELFKKIIEESAHIQIEDGYETGENLRDCGLDSLDLTEILVDLERVTEHHLSDAKHDEIVNVTTYSNLEEIFAPYL